MDGALTWAIKGHIAEMMVEWLFKKSGYQVRLFGGPWRFRTWNMLEGMEGPHQSMSMGGARIRTDEPDYLIYPKGKINDQEFVEVKFRFKGRLSHLIEKDVGIIDQCKFWSTKRPTSVIVVSALDPPYITTLKPPYVDANGRFTRLVPVVEAGWNINQAAYQQCAQMIYNGVFNGVRV